MNHLRSTNDYTTQVWFLLTFFNKYSKNKITFMATNLKGKPISNTRRQLIPYTDINCSPEYFFDYNI